MCCGLLGILTFLGYTFSLFLIGTQLFGEVLQLLHTFPELAGCFLQPTGKTGEAHSLTKKTNSLSSQKRTALKDEAISKLCKAITEARKKRTLLFLSSTCLMSA